MFRQWLEYKYSGSLKLLRVTSRRSCVPGNADAFSRLLLPSTIDHIPSPGNILLFSQLSKQIVSAEHIKKWTEKDLVLSRVRRLIQSDGEIPDTETELRPFPQKASE